MRGISGAHVFKRSTNDFKKRQRKNNSLEDGDDGKLSSGEDDEIDVPGLSILKDTCTGAASSSTENADVLERESPKKKLKGGGDIPVVLPFAGAPTKGRTVSVAIPASIVENCQSFELKAYLAGQIARTLTIFGVDEVIVYEDSSRAVASGKPTRFEFLGEGNTAEPEAAEPETAKPETAEPETAEPQGQCDGTETKSIKDNRYSVNCYGGFGNSLHNRKDRKFAPSNLADLIEQAQLVANSNDLLVDACADASHESADENDVSAAALSEPSAACERQRKLEKRLASERQRKGFSSDGESDAASAPDDLPENAASFDDRRWSNSLEFLVRNLAYLETPQYLRRKLFKMHPTLRMAGLQNPLDAPHHLRANEWLPFREGVVTGYVPKSSGSTSLSGQGAWKQEKETKESHSSLVDVGLPIPACISGVRLILNQRVTVQFKPNAHKQFQNLEKQRKQQWRRKGRGTHSQIAGYFSATLIDRSIPPTIHGCYWGYRVRAASSLKDAIQLCPFAGQYDFLVGTSERGQIIDPKCRDPMLLNSFASFKHCLLVFGGLAGLEEVLADDICGFPAANKPEELFQAYLNVCPYQRSRTIRTEEAVLITLALLRPYLLPSY